MLLVFHLVLVLCWSALKVDIKLSWGENKCVKVPSFAEIQN